MRVRQTARKSTATPARNAAGSSAASTTSMSNTSTSSSSHPDPVRTRMRSLLHTKRKSSTPTSRIKEEFGNQPYGVGAGKRLPYSVGSSGQGVKVKPRKSQQVSILRQIRSLQKGTDLLIPKLPFHRLVREITHGIAESVSFNHVTLDFKYQVAALEALQEAAEAYLVQFFEDSYLCTQHAKRVTLFVSDMHLCRRLQRHQGRY